MSKLNKLKTSYWIVLFFGITAAYFIWLSWRKLSEIIGNTTLVWGITGGIVVLGMIIGTYSFKRLAEKFK